MPIIKIDGKPTFVDFVEYARPKKSFADTEYEKWLKQRDEERVRSNVQNQSTERIN